MTPPPRFYPRRGEKVRDVRTGRIGTATGETQTMHPPAFCVTWDDDGSLGAIGSRFSMHCLGDRHD